VTIILHILRHIPTEEYRYSRPQPPTPSPAPAQTATGPQPPTPSPAPAQTARPQPPTPSPAPVQTAARSQRPAPILAPAQPAAEPEQPASAPPLRKQRGGRPRHGGGRPRHGGGRPRHGGGRRVPSPIQRQWPHQPSRAARRGHPTRPPNSRAAPSSRDTARASFPSVAGDSHHSSAVSETLPLPHFPRLPTIGFRAHPPDGKFLSGRGEMHVAAAGLLKEAVSHCCRYCGCAVGYVQLVEDS